MQLSKRLELVASFVPEGSRIADVGTDHGYVPIVLVERGRCPGAVAMDVREGPLKRAGDHIRARGLEDKIETRLCDGLSGLAPGEADTVVIAGMGGELLLRILGEGRHVWGSVRYFVLSPQSDLDKVRRYLEAEGFLLLKEAMVLDEGKYYTVLLAGRGKEAADTYKRQSWYLYGKKLIEGRDQVLRGFLEKEGERLEKILLGLEGRETAGAAAAREGILRQLAMVREVQEDMGCDVRR